MASSKSMTAMIAMTRELADMENSTFVDDTELTARINEGIKQLYDKLVAARGPEYYAESDTAATAVGQAVYDFATDFTGLTIPFFYKLVSVMIDDGTTYVDVPRFEYSDLANLRTLEGISNPTLWTYRYRLTATGIELRPKPTTTSHTLTVHFIPAFTAITGATTFDGINGWEKWACLTAAIDCMNKEESDPSGLMAQRALLDAQIEKLAPFRDLSRPSRVSDTRKDWVGGYARNERY